MADTSLVKLDWKDKLHFHVSQANYSSDTGDFSYFHVHQAPNIATFKAQGVSDSDLDQLTNLNILSTQANDTATVELGRDIKRVQIPDNLSQQQQISEWTQNLDRINEKAAQYITNTIKGNRDKAMEIISAMPAMDQQYAADFYIRWMNIAMEAFQLMADKDQGLYGAIPEFIRKIWSAVKGVVDSVSEKVTSCVTRLRPLKTP
ncbi:hypothetical protein L207DRAFT_150123 [Hyaloscypha variabilis F]|uniref:Uncharacterized protein n=1 Tax=Hyaloscypha variabilis (strain UAMH 11265 / GT02V1 / F) TaxID=1149755 RepID=A0A2J6S8A3_HYAVF|nr:hypothetical protein L207DRAFT_150123 [Hyaloscypha variabilis F]